MIENKEGKGNETHEIHTHTHIYTERESLMQAGLKDKKEEDW